MSAVATFGCPMCGCPLQWLTSDGRLAGIKAHWNWVHRPSITWVGYLARCGLQDGTL